MDCSGGNTHHEELIIGFGLALNDLGEDLGSRALL
jgi:hypothetical protein